MEGNRREVRLHLETCKFEAVKVITLFFLVLKRSLSLCLLSLFFTILVCVDLSLVEREKTGFGLKTERGLGSPQKKFSILATPSLS